MKPSELGRLEKVDIREYFKSESQDFTPWLATEENIGSTNKIKRYSGSRTASDKHLVRKLVRIVKHRGGAFLKCHRPSARSYDIASKFLIMKSGDAASRKSPGSRRISGIPSSLQCSEFRFFDSGLDSDVRRF
jgi:hypothetical protein